MKAVDRIILIGYVALPLVALTGGILHLAHRTTFYALMLLLAAFLVKNHWLRAFMIYLFGWVFYLLVAYFLAAATSRPVNLAILFGIYMLFAAYAVKIVSESQAPKRVFYDAICVAAVLQTLVAVCQMWEMDPFYKVYSLFIPLRRGLEATEPAGTLGNTNFLAAYLTISMPFFFRRYWLYFVPLLVAIPLVAVQSTAVVAVVVGCTYYMWPRIKKRWLGLGLVPFIIYLCIFKKSLTIHFTLDHPRIQWWIAAIKQTSSNSLGFLFGMGPSAPWGGNFPIHNEWVTIFHHFGIIGSLIIAGYILTLKRSNRMVYTAFIITAINAIGYYPFHLATTGLLVLLVVGLLERERLEAPIKISKVRSGCAERRKRV